MPWIFREESRNYFRQEKEMMSILEQFDGLLIKNLEEMEYLQDMGYRGKIALDANLYIWNNRAMRFWKKENIDWITLPEELTDQELRQVQGKCPGNDRVRIYASYGDCTVLSEEYHRMPEDAEDSAAEVIVKISILS